MKLTKDERDKFSLTYIWLRRKHPDWSHKRLVGAILFKMYRSRKYAQNTENSRINRVTE